jgi:hypothetical protein
MALALRTRRPTMQALQVAMLATVLAGCGADRDHRALREARDAMAATLPAPYVEDLVIESVSIEGDALVQRVRSPEGRAAATRDHPRFDELRQGEQEDLYLLCTHPAVQSLAGTGARVVRRFVDRDDAVFFEVELRARECAGRP